MKRSTLSLLLFAAILLFLPACEVVGGIFKAGMVWGIFLVAIVIAAIIYLVFKSKK